MKTDAVARPLSISSDFLFLFCVGTNLRQSQCPVSEVVMGSSEEEYQWFD